VAGIAVPASADQVTIISVQTGHSLVIDAPRLSRVAVGDSRIAGVVPIGTSQIVINGKSSGHTTVFVWSAGARKSYEITVTEQGFDDVAKILRTAINEPDVQVIAYESNVFVRGSVPDGQAFARLNDILTRFSGAKFNSSGKGGDAKIINMVSVARPLGDLQQRLSTIPGATDLRVDPDAKGNVIVSGTVRDRASAEAVLNRVRGLSGPYLASDGKVIDRLATEMTSQVDVKVYILEVDRTASSQLGLRLQSALVNGAATAGGAAAGGQTFTLGPPQFVGIENPNPSNSFGKVLGLGSIARATLLAPTLDLLMSEGHAKLLSSPDLVTLPGSEATFLVGGKIPIPVSNGLGSVTVQYVDFGVKLKVTPTVLGSGGIECKITPEVSNLDFADAVTLNGFTIPALKISTLSTDVITQTGESIVMGGLLNRIESVNVQKIPLLSDIPILGKLFRSTNYQKSETDVVFILTPTIITR
jgi:pilus assembly protein CpaC